MTDRPTARRPSLRGLGMPDLPYTAVLFAGIWLVYLIEPIAAAWQIRGSLAGVVGMASTVGFATVYMWHFIASRAFAWGDTKDEHTFPDSAALRYLRYTLLVVLAVVATLAVGQKGTTTWVFVAVAGLWTYGFIWGFGVALGIAALYEFLAYHVDGWDRDSGVSLAIALAVLAVGGGMLAARRQWDLSAARRENARLAVQEERNRMARDLHDILGHSLTVITVKAELAGRLVEVDPGRAKAEIDSLESLAREALADVRGAVEGFREISLAGELVQAREALAAAGIEARLPRAVEGLPADVRELYAWTVREGVTNVIRHSGARRCTVSIADGRLTIRDDGVGTRASAGSGNGLRGLHERAAAAGAVLQTTRGPGGFEVAVIIREVPALRSPSRQPPEPRPATVRP